VTRIDLISAQHVMYHVCMSMFILLNICHWRSRRSRNSKSEKYSKMFS